MNYTIINYACIIFSLVLICCILCILCVKSSPRYKREKKFIDLLLKFGEQDNFTNIDNSSIKDNNKIMYWTAPLNNDVQNSKGNFSNSGVTNILNNSSLINIDCSQISDIPKHVHYRIVDSDGKLSGVYVNKNNISDICAK
jgi:hypothetical protein